MTAIQGIDHGANYNEHICRGSVIQVRDLALNRLMLLTVVVSYILRLLGTFVGAVVGLLCWYIGEIS